MSRLITAQRIIEKIHVVRLVEEARLVPLYNGHIFDGFLICGAIGILVVSRNNRLVEQRVILLLLLLAANLLLQRLGASDLIAIAEAA